MSNNITPQKIKLHRQSCILEICFNGMEYRLGAEYLRVFSPSAEVRGHGPGEEILQLNKQNVAITGIDPQGNYAIKLIFSDGHDSGIYSWTYLADLCHNQDGNWQAYLAKVALHEAEEKTAAENKDVSAVKWVDPKT